MRHLIFIICITIGASCQKSNDYVVNQTGKQSDLHGQWVRGNFDMHQFWNYVPSSQISQNLRTQAFTFDVDNRCEYFDINLSVEPTDSSTLTWLHGTCRFDMEKRQFTFTPAAGIHRVFKPGKPESSLRLVTEEELQNSRVTYNLQTGFLSNQPFLAVSFAESRGQRLVFQKSTW